VGLYRDNFPAGAFLLPLVGIGALWGRNRRLVVGLLLAMVAVIGFDLCYQIEDIAPYYLTAWLAAATLLAGGLDLLLVIAQRHRRGILVVTSAGPLLVAFLLMHNWQACDLSRATWVREFARHKLENTDPVGVLLSSGDDDTFPLWYVHDVLKVRPDVFHVDRTMSGGVWSNEERDPSRWYLYRLRRQGIAAPIRVSSNKVTHAYLANDGYLIDRLMGELRGRPLCTTFFTSHEPRSRDSRVFFRWAGARYRVLPQGILLRLQPRSQPVVLAELLSRNQQLWKRIALPDLHGINADQDLDPDYVSNHYACMLENYAGLCEMAGDRPGAEALYRRLISWDRGYQPAAVALAALLKRETHLRSGGLHSSNPPPRSRCSGRMQTRATTL
jgi:hypothetical protein